MPDDLKEPWSFLVPWLLFFILILVKLLVFFYGMIVLSGLLQPGRIKKFGAKVFGIEISGEYDASHS